MTLEKEEEEELRALALESVRSIAHARKKAEEDLLRVQQELRDSARRLELALAAAQLGDWTWDATNDLVTLGPRALEISGLPAGKSMTWISMAEYLHVDDRERVRQAVSQAMQMKADYDVEYRVTKPSGENAWIAAKGRVTCTPEGIAQGMVGVVQDITKRKHAEQILRDSEQQLRATFAQAAVGIAIAGMDGKFMSMNRKFCEILGYAPDELQTMTFRQITHPDDLLETESYVTRLKAGQLNDYGIEKRYRRKDGHYVWCQATVTLVRDETGSPGQFIGVIDDITSRKQTEAALAATAHDNVRLYQAAQQSAEEKKALLESEREARAAAERLNTTKDEFLATLSHELRTPLSAILGWTQILRHVNAKPEDVARGIEVIERNARAQAQLIDDLLDMSRITSGKVRLDIQPVLPYSFVQAAVDALRPAADAKGVRLETMLDPLAGPISGDPGRLQQVVWNLLSNAVKYTPRNGKVQVRLECVNSQIEITVADTGSGIDPDFLNHAFERFRQADSSTTRSHGGLGLGLSIVRHLVEQHGGTVQASSPGIGKGATFTVQLPLTVIHPSAQTEERLHPRTNPLISTVDFRNTDLSGLRVLVVEDEPDARDMIARVLSDCRATVITAKSASEALQQIAQGPPEILISDVGMPEMDGYELLRRVRKLSPEAGGQIPAIALTAFARSEDRTQALRAGFHVHVAKPVEPSELVASVASVAGRAKLP